MFIVEAATAASSSSSFHIGISYDFIYETFKHIVVWHRARQTLTKVADNIRFNPKANRLGKYFILVWQNLLIYSSFAHSIAKSAHREIWVCNIDCLCFMNISIWYGNCRPCNEWSNLNAIIRSREQNLIANSGLPLWIIFLLLWHSLCLAKFLIWFSFGVHTFWSGWW